MVSLQLTRLGVGLAGLGSYLTSRSELGLPWRKQWISFDKTQSLSRFQTAVVSKFRRIAEQDVPNRAEQVQGRMTPGSKLFAQWRFLTAKPS